MNNGEITSWGFDFIWTATVVFHLNDVTVVFNLIKMCFIGSAKKTLSLMVRTKSSNRSPTKNSGMNTPIVAKNEKQLPRKNSPPAAFRCQGSSDSHY